MSLDEGWLLINNQLFFTGDNGGSWKNISPDGTQTQKIAAVFFLDRKHAWVGLSNPGPLLSNFVLETTDDAGVTWKTLLSSIPVQEAAIPLSNTVHMQWLDTKTGWLLFEESTSSSFSAGRLFKTADGGITWAELSSPVGESIYFASASSGWTVGREGDGLYRTKNGGASWQPTLIGEQPGGHAIQQYGLPTFDTSNDGLIPVLTREVGGDRGELRLYSTQDGGDSWSLVHRLILKPDSGTLSIIPLDLIDSRHATVLIPRTDQILGMLDKQTYKTLNNRDGLARKIVQIDMLNTAAGWAAWRSKSCGSISKLDLAPGAGGTANCVIETRLLSTADGGATWSSLPLPAGVFALTSETLSVRGKTQAPSTAIAAASGTQVFIGQGFDTCVPPSLTEMQDWWNNSPYDIWNLYIGGSNRGCKTANQAITASFISQLYQQGWQFIPTWVGLQASCSTLNVYKMSSDPDTAYGQGVADANAASDTAISLGFSNTIIYFDLEYFSANDTACKAAAKAFISGWTAQLHSRGNQAAVYGSACGSGLDNYYTIANVPDAIWPAIWDQSGYDSSASVWGMLCIPDNHWSNHQRIRQYAGDHDESWGSTTLNIDSDVLDGIVAVPGPNCSNPSPDGSHIGLYSEDDYCGAYTMLAVGDYDNASALGIADNSVSSIKLGADVKATLCSDDNYLGACESFAANDPHLGDNNSIGDDQVSSAKVMNKLQLVAPANAANVPSRRPPFDWSDVPGASGYNIQVARTANFATLLRNTAVASSTYTPATDLPAGAVLYWRVRAKISGVYHSWSEVRSFKTANPPSVPALKAPVSGVLLRDYTPLLDWYDSTLPVNSAYGFDHYELQLAANAAFTTDVLIFTTAVGNRAASSYVIPDGSTLTPNRTYYWHVRAFNTGGEYSSWSVSRNFRTVILPPSLISPHNVGPVGSRKPAFDWQDGIGASGYRIQISRVSTFSTLVAQANIVPSTFTPGIALPAGATLYWRVQATGKNGPSAWSEVWQFTTP